MHRLFLFLLARQSKLYCISDVLKIPTSNLWLLSEEQVMGILMSTAVMERLSDSRSPEAYRHILCCSALVLPSAQSAPRGVGRRDQWSTCLSPPQPQSLSSRTVFDSSLKPQAARPAFS